MQYSSRALFLVRLLTALMAATSAQRITTAVIVALLVLERDRRCTLRMTENRASNGASCST